MKMQPIAGTPLQVSRIAFGCMRLAGPSSPGSRPGRDPKSALAAVRTALEEGINLFDHADIYGRGKCEEIFSGIWQESPNLRGNIILQSKCGIRLPGDPEPTSPGRYDFSYEHILRAVEGSLRRLKTDYLDILLLHRPDALVQPEEVARALDELQASGKVRYFGVSNHTAAQIKLLRRWVKQPLVINQVELNVAHTHLFNEGVSFNQNSPAWQVRDEGTLEYCRLHDIMLQAWSPAAGGAILSDSWSNDERVTTVSRLIAAMAWEKSVSREAIAIAWLLRHPAGIQPILGTTKPDRVRASCQGDQIELSREEWYRLFSAGRGAPVP